MIVIKKYRIIAENIYNFDEKGFLISFKRFLKRIMTLEVLKLKQVTESKQDGSREFISCLAYIFAIGRWILLLLIYKGESGSLISTWVNLVDTDA